MEHCNCILWLLLRPAGFIRCHDVIPVSINKPVFTSAFLTISEQPDQALHPVVGCKNQRCVLLCLVRIISREDGRQSDVSLWQPSLCLHKMQILCWSSLQVTDIFGSAVPSCTSSHQSALHSPLREEQPCQLPNTPSQRVMNHQLEKLPFMPSPHERRARFAPFPGLCPDPLRSHHFPAPFHGALKYWTL